MLSGNSEHAIRLITPKMFLNKPGRLHGYINPDFCNMKNQNKRYDSEKSQEKFDDIIVDQNEASSKTPYQYKNKSRIEDFENKENLNFLISKNNKFENAYKNQRRKVRKDQQDDSYDFLKESKLDSN